MPTRHSPNARSSVTQAEPTDHQTHRALERLEVISRLFDDAVRIPGTRIRLGWDAVLGLIPVGGDAITTLITGYYMWEAQRLGARKRVLLKMLANSGIDFLVGLVPLVGDLADVTWRANRKNMRVLVRELQTLGKLPSGVDPRRVARLLGERGTRPPRRSAQARTLAARRPLMMP